MAKNIAPLPASGSAPAASGAVNNVSGAPSPHTIVVARKAAQAADPALQPLGKHPYAPREVSGASYGTQVGFEAAQAPEAGLTQANGRLMQSAINRSAPNFRAGTAESY